VGRLDEPWVVDDLASGTRRIADGANVADGATVAVDGTSGKVPLL
jgi:hypothetical protein